MKILFFCILTILLPDNIIRNLMNGDLIFQESCSAGVSTAIKEVTTSIDSTYHFTHVGIVYIDKNDSIFVIEATTPCVMMTPIQDFLYPSDVDCMPISVVGRLKEPYQHLIPDAITEGLRLIGKEYDYGYVLNNDKYYCSELIYEILLKANDGKSVFELNTMTFKSPMSENISTNWIKYFENHHLPIPEGELGINPGAMSKSKVIDILY